MAVPETDRPDVDELAAEFVERQRAGESPTIDEYALRFPELADEIRELFPTIMKLEGLKHHLSGSSSGQAGVGLPGLTRLGDFRIVRELGRGGMGVVYEAEQESLRRRVALKVLGANISASPKLLARFRREAESAARLHHTNIVPVFGVGEEHGVFFYAMQYIEGAPLNSIIHALRDSPMSRTIGEVVEQCAPSSQTGGGEPSLSETVADSTSSDCNGQPLLARLEFGKSAVPPRVVVSETPDTALPESESAVPGSAIEPRLAARMAADLADALHFAHLHGVLHRDVKPANILVDRESAVWITDFGLAKHDESGDLTRSGDVIGTLRYMAPEQLHGQTDVRSDVYSLGLTLHEMLAGQPAFDEDLRAPLIQRKTEQPPPPLRSLNGRIPRDLETIVQKACAPLATDRYQTAMEFAEDLHRFIEERPIRARRLPVLARTWRWMRRNPVVASLSMLAATLLIAVGVAVGIGNYNTNRALDEALTQQKRAQTNLNAAVAALQEITKDISSRGVPQSLHVTFEGSGNGDGDSTEEEAILQATPVTAADAELLKKLLRFFDEFAASNETDLTAETARIQLQIGEIRHRLGQYQEAEAAYGQARATYEALLAKDPGNVDVTIAIAETWNRIGTVQADRGRVSHAMFSHNAARDAIETSPAAMAEDRGKFTLARTFTLYYQIFGRAGAADLIARSGSAREADDHQGRGNETSPSTKNDAVPFDEVNAERAGQNRTNRPNGRREGPRFGRGADGASRSRWRSTRNNPGAEIRRNFPPESIVRAIDILEDLVQRNPENSLYRLSLAQSYRVQMVQSRFDRSENSDQAGSQAAERAIEILIGLTNDYPDNPQYRYELADTYCMTVRFQRDLSSDETTERIDDALAICDALKQAYPQVPSYQALAAVAERRRAFIHRQSGNLDAAERYYDSASDTYRELTQRFPTVSLYPIALAQTLSESASTLQEAGDHDRAWEQAVSAVVVAENCRPLRPTFDPFFHGFVMRLKHQRDRLESQLGPYPEAPEPPADL